jgi:hypothetical protein
LQRPGAGGKIGTPERGAKEKTENSMRLAGDAVLAMRPELATRTSYVIESTGEILRSYTDLSPSKHVGNMLGVVEKYVSEQPKS